MRVSVAAVLLAVLLAIANRNAKANESALLSPPLDVLGSRCLGIVAPSGWRVTDQEPIHAWNDSSYDFSLVPPSGIGLATAKIQAEVLQHGIERARLHGDLDGQPFRTASGLRGIIRHAEFRPGTRDWYLTIPVRSTESALIVRLTFQSDDLAKQRSFVRGFYRSVRFLVPSRRRSVKT